MNPTRWVYDANTCKFTDDHDNSSDYFDRHHEEERQLAFSNNLRHLPVIVKQEPVTPNEMTKPHNADVFQMKEIKSEIISPLCQGFGMRKSLSMGDLTSIMHLSNKVSDKYSSSSNLTNKSHNVTDIKGKLEPKKFVSMAEQIYHHQRDTPKRFHSTNKKNILDKVKFNYQPPQRTIPQSPALMCKNRMRPVTVISQQEIEEREIEKIKTYKIKANPIPKSVLDGTGNLAPVVRKPNTVPVPFHLTELKPKFPKEEEKFIFVAKPAPKKILENPQIIEPIRCPVTIPESPHFLISKRKANTSDNVKDKAKFPQLKKTTKLVYDNTGGAMIADTYIAHSGVPPTRVPQSSAPKPFSFLKRDEELKQKKEEMIKKILEEEKKLRQFKANPIPNVIKKKMELNSSCGSSVKSNKENHSDNTIKNKFEAKPAKVLSKQPFVPVLERYNPIETCPFKLTTTVRATQREMFNQQMREKELQEEKIRQARELELKQREEREIAELRSQLVHHANPIRRYIPLVVHPNNMTVTVPQSPHLITKKINRAASEFHK